MLTPIEIRKHEFKRSIRGYTDTEVDSFIAQVADDYEHLYRENMELKEAIKRLEFDMAKYKNLEETLNQTLVMAQQAAEEMRANARKEAELMLENARRKINEIFMVYEEIIKRLNVYRTEMKSMITAQSELMQKQDARIDEIIGFFYSKDMKELLESLSRLKIAVPDKSERNDG